LLDAIALKQAICTQKISGEYRRLLLLALISEVTFSASNVKFGPELYCGPTKRGVNVHGGFRHRVEKMCSDLNAIDGAYPFAAVNVILGDSRDLKGAGLRSASFDAAICSPPYPAEHDYTRISRLELAFLEEVSDVASLRAIKYRMIRSNTKNIYVADRDEALVRHHRLIQQLIAEIKYRVNDRSDGFSRYYPRVIGEYFGGMLRHFRELHRVLKPGKSAAFVVGDQSAYAQVHIPTAAILATLAEEAGLKIVELQHWRHRRVSTTSKLITENILLIRK
jgi:hypothetical protein